MNLIVSRIVTVLAVTIALLMSIFALAWAQPQSQSTQINLKVVELFTSQGCPRSPIADTNLAKLSERNDVLALTFPVSYWDYLGWEDTFATAEFDKRQKFYVARLNDQWLSTPSAVVQGQFGTFADDLEAFTRTVESAPSLEVALPSLKWSADRANLQMPRQLPTVEGAAYKIAFYKPGLSQVLVETGKNAGKKLSYINIVRSLINYNEFLGSVPKLLQESQCALLLQDESTGRILGASLCKV